MCLDKISLEALENQLAKVQLENDRLRKEIEFLQQNSPSDMQNLYRFLSDNDTQNLVLLDPEGKIVAASSLASVASKTLYGKTLTPGKFITEVIPAEHAEQFSRLLNAALAGKTGSADFPLFAPDSRQRWLRYHFRPARKSSEKSIGVFMTTVEITDQKQAEIARQESEERFRQAFQFSPHGFIISRLEDGRIIEVNQSFARITGYKLKEPVGKTLDEMNLFSDPRDLAHCLQKLKQSRSFRNLEVGIRLAGGQTIACLLSAIVLTLGGVEHSLLSIQDIEEIKQTQEALRSSQARFKELSDSIDEMFFALNEKLEITYWNRAACLYTGIAAKNALGKPLQQVLPVIAEETGLRSIRLALESQKPQQITADYYLGGSQYVFEMGIYPSARGIVILCKNITERQHVIRREKQQAQDLEMLSEFAADFVTISAEKDLYALIGNHLRRLTGCVVAMVNTYLPDSQRLAVRSLACEKAISTKLRRLNRKPIIDTTCEIDKTAYAALSQGTLKVLDEQFVDHIADKTGWFQIIAEMLNLGDVYTIGLTYNGQLFGNIVLMFSKENPLRNPEMVQTYTNIAAGAIQRRMAEQSLQESEQKFRSFIEQASEGIFLINDHGCVAEWNRGQELITGVKAEEAIDQPIGEVFQRLAPSGSIPFIQGDLANTSILEAIRTGTSPWFYIPNDVDIRTPSGEHKSTQITMFPIQIKNGSLIGGITREITASKQRQREMEAIISVNKALRPLSSPAEMLPVISAQLMSLLNLEGVAIILNNPISDENRVEFAEGLWEKLTGLFIPSGEGVVSQVIQSGEVYLNNDTIQKPDQNLVDIQGVYPKSVACMPLATRDQVLGAIWIGQSHPISEESLRITKIISEITAAAMHRSSLYGQLQRRLDHISALRLIDRTIASNLDLKIGLHVLLDQVVTQLNVDSAAILLINPRTQYIEFGDGRGFRTELVKKTYLSIGEGLTGRAVLERNILFIPDLRNAADKFTRKEMRLQEDFVSYCAAPLMIKGEVKGVLELFTRAPLTPTAEWLEFLENLAGQAAIMIDNSELYSRLQQSNLELRLAYSRTLEGWVRALDLRDEETEGHTQRVTEMTLRLAISMGMPDDRLVHIQRGALLHDIGKMAVPDSILRKPGKLTKKEWEIMRRHPLVAYELLRPIAFLQESLDIPYCHHERWDGSGYPRGLKGEEIPLAARIFSVVDVWDALSFNRPYRTAWSEDKARDYISANSGKLFDAKVVEAFLELLERDSSR
ncbi:MAG: PAS domain S-box protein [Anaerolineae bacterium]|nr:PAS domain S-box protein [Anaerolineae bacterium]